MLVCFYYSAQFHLLRNHHAETHRFRHVGQVVFIEEVRMSHVKFHPTLSVDEVHGLGEIVPTVVLQHFFKMGHFRQAGLIVLIHAIYMDVAFFHGFCGQFGYVHRFEEEIVPGSPNSQKIIWLHNYADVNSKESNTFEREFLLPYGGELDAAEGGVDKISDGFKNLAEKVLAMPKIGSQPGDFASYDKETSNPEILEYRTKLRLEVVGSLEKKFGQASDF